MMAAYTLVHVVISLIAIGAGFVVLAGLLGGKRLDGWTAFFLVTTGHEPDWIRLSLCPPPAVSHRRRHFVGSARCGCVARYRCHLANGWRTTYVITAVTALYLNVFVLVVQMFQKVPALAALAPTQSEPPFAIAQLIVLARSWPSDIVP